MSVSVLLGVGLLLLPGALAIGTALAVRSRVDDAVPTRVVRAAIATWVASAIALEAGIWLGAYVTAVTLGRVAPVVAGPDFWWDDWLLVNRLSSWLLLGGLGLWLLGFVVLAIGGRRSGR